MANTKSSKKDIRRIAKRRIRNLQTRTALKTMVKKVRQAVDGGDATVVNVSLADAVSALDKAAQRGIIHKNAAARRKSRIAKVVAKAAKAGPAPVVEVEAKPKKAATPKAAKPAAKKAAAPKPAKEPAAKPAAAKKPAAKKAPKAE